MSKKKSENKKKIKDRNQSEAQKNSKSFMKDKGLFFVPLGGSEQFGVNLNVYVCDGELLAIDCGIGFADERFPGIDLLLPDPTFLEKNKKKLKGLVITHAHEDHIGAVPYLWKRFKCPIYASEFTAAVLRKKFEEFEIDPKITVIDAPSRVEIGPFGVEFIPVAHSVPNTCSLVLETSYGRVVHSGDWNLDPKPIVDGPTREDLFKEAGEKGVLAYVGDSTNGGVPGRAGSESEVEEGLAKEFKNCKGKIAVTMFSSNVGRIISIVRAAEKCDRRVAIVGRSLHRMVGCAIQCGYMNDLPDFIDEEEIGYLPDDKVVMIVTGSQGEWRAALAKMARGAHRNVNLNENDTVIFSARAIPGNDRQINEVKNNLSAADVNIITPDDTKNKIHVSGHPCQDEIADMLQWVKPQTLIPVHGERMNLDAHAEFAKQCQISNIVVPSNGSVIQLAPGVPETVDHVETDLLAVDQKRIITADHYSIVERRKLQYSGVVHVTVAIDGKGKVVDADLTTLGLVDLEEAGEEQIEDNLYNEIMDLLDDMKKRDRQDEHFVQEELRIGARRFVYNLLGMKPKTSVHVMMV